MGKLVVLELDGDLEHQGFRVKLEVGEEGQRPTVKLSGALPCEPDLGQSAIGHWLNYYRPLGAPSARQIRPKGIEYQGSTNAKVKACEESGKNLCQRLNQWLSSPSFREIDAQIREELHRDDSIRFTIRTTDELLQKLPWHTWQLFSRYPHAEINLSSPEFQHPSAISNTPPGKVRILAILGHPDRLNLTKDREILENLPQADVKFLIEPKTAEINDRLWEEPWDILFFAGHSETDEDSGKIYINDQEFLTVDQIWYGLRKAVNRGLKLAIFNSCDGLGLARRLDDFQIPQMIVMRDLVPDEVAQKFLRSFLVNFSQGSSFEMAVREAREQLQGLENEIPCATWLPVVWQHPDYISPTWTDLVGQSRWRSFKFSPRKIIALSVCIGLITHFWIRPEIAKYLNLVGWKYMRSEQYTQALPYLEWAIKIDSKQDSAPNNLATIYELWQEDDMALPLYRRSKLLGNSWGCRGQAKIYIKRKQFDRAEDLLRQCVVFAIQEKSLPAEYLARSYLGLSLLKKDSQLKRADYDEAQKHLILAIALEPEEGIANCILAQVLETQGKPDEALTQWKFCVKFAKDEYPNEAEWIKMGKTRMERYSGN